MKIAKHQLGWLVLIVATFAFRLAGLGSVLTIDEPLWQQRAGQFIQALVHGDLVGTMPTAQPGVPTMIIAAATHRFESLALDQASLGVVTSLLILVTTFFLTQLWGKPWGLVGGFLLALEPYFIAHNRVVHTDGLLAASMLASLVAFLAALAPLEQHQPIIKRYVIFSGVLVSIAILTKLFGLLLIPVIVAILLLAGFRRRAPIRTLGQTLGIWILALGITTYAVWPVLWIPKSPAYAYLFKWTTIHAEGLRSGDVTANWWFYGREIPFRLTIPTSILLPLSLIAVLLPTFRRRYPDMYRTGLILVGAGLFYAAVMSFAAEKGDRYVLFTIVTLSLFSALGLRLLTDWLASKKTAWALVPGAALLLFLAADNMRLHPHYLSHFNRLYPVEERHKVGLGEGLEAAGAWIKSQKADAKITSFAPRIINHFYPDSTESLEHIDGFNPDYIVIYRGMFERPAASLETKLVKEYLDEGREPAHIVTINSLPYAWIYEPE